MLVERKDLDLYLPQKHPIQLVHCLAVSESERAVTFFEVEKGHLFEENGRLSPSGVIENMAQSIALDLGYKYYIEQEGDVTDPKIGYIAAVKKMKFYELPKVGDKIQTEILVINKVFGVSIVSAVVKLNNKVICESELKIILAEEIE